MSDLQEFKDNMRNTLFGETKLGHCFICEQPFEIHPCVKDASIPLPTMKERKEGMVWSYAGMKEINISGICEYCFDKMYEDKEE